MILMDSTLRNTLLIVLLFITTNSTAFNLTQFLRKQPKIKCQPLFTKSEFSEITRSKAYKKYTPQLTQKKITQRDYRSSTTDEMFYGATLDNLHLATQYLITELYDTAAISPPVVDQDLLTEPQRSINEMHGQEIHYQAHSLESTASGKIGSNEDRAFSGSLKLNSKNDENIIGYYSAVADGHTLKSSTDSANPITQDSVTDYIRFNFERTLKEAFKSFVNLNKEHTIEKALVYTYTTLSRNITSSATFDTQGSTLNLILILPRANDTLHLFLANTGNTLCFLFNKIGLKQRYSQASINVDVIKKLISEKTTGQSLHGISDSLTNELWLLNFPHGQIMPENYDKQYFTPFGGCSLITDKDGKIDGLSSVFNGHQLTANYRCLGDKLLAPVISPTPDVISIPLQSGDCLVQVTESQTAAHWAQLIHNTLSDTKESLCASSLAVQAGCEHNDSTVVTVFIKR